MKPFGVEHGGDGAERSTLRVEDAHPFERDLLAGVCYRAASPPDFCDSLTMAITRSSRQPPSE
jgi:hypothetical protein